MLSMTIARTKGETALSSELPEGSWMTLLAQLTALKESGHEKRRSLTRRFMRGFSPTVDTFSLRYTAKVYSIVAIAVGFFFFVVCLRLFIVPLIFFALCGL